MESLQRVKLARFEIVISELEIELDYLPGDALLGGMIAAAPASAGHFRSENKYWNTLSR
jgi:hypothetical protein